MIAMQTFKNTLTKLDVQENQRPDALSKHVGKYQRYPISDSKRIAEGGLRLKGVHKTNINSFPLVTIITVCRNSEQTIQQTFDSVRAQSYPNIEYLVIDACSSDNTLNLIQENEDLIDYYLSEHDRGLYHAMNKGIELAQGDYILILNSDDWYEPNCVESLLKALKLTNADFTCALARWVGGDGKAIKVLEKMPYDHSLNFGNSLRHELMLISKEIYNQVGLYNEKYPIIADLDFTLRLFDEGYKLYELCVPLLNFRVTGTSNTNWEKLDSEHFLLLKTRFPDIDLSSLKKLSCERDIDAEMLIKILSTHPTNSVFEEALIAYGYRRGFFDSSNQPPKRHKRNSPRVSIAMPAYNASDFIRNTINSILQQELADIEVVCVNDCSTDNTLEILNNIASNDQRLKVYTNERNQGETITRNRALSYCKGEYVLFVDADDQVTHSGLNNLVEFADSNYSDMVKGGMEKVNPNGSRINLFGFPPNSNHSSLNCSDNCINTTLSSSRVFLRATEGFFTYLYRRSFLQNFKFPEGYKMGGDSLFLATILSNAMRLSWIDTCVIKYVQHPNQATKTYNWEKMLDDIDWRYKVWQIMNLQGLKDVGDYIAHEYWDPKVLGDLPNFLDSNELRDVSNRFAVMLGNTGFKDAASLPNNEVVNFMRSTLSHNETVENSSYNLNPLHKSQDKLNLNSIKIGVFNTFKAGGAAIASHRLRDGLRKNQINAQSYSVFNDNPDETNQKIRCKSPLKSLAEAQQEWENLNIKPAYDTHQCSARELFSLKDSLTNPSHLIELFKFFDILHFHWVSGLIDYNVLSAIPPDKPIVWTLHDMHPFTGGCHYSEGCLNFVDDCSSCHLLKPGSTLAKCELSFKKRALDRLTNIQVIAPSLWLKELAEKSQIFKGRPVHHVPNIIPSDVFTPTNQVVARIKLGLPRNKILLLFGADNIKNIRKGGDLLQRIAQRLKMTHESADIEVVFFGKGKLSIPYPTHNLGHISDENKLALVYSAADVFIFPSREDNAPMSVAESLLCGTPVVCSNVGNARELIDHKKNSFIAESEDILEFCNGIDWILSLNDFERLELRSLCRISASRYHHKDSIIRRLSSIYEDALRNK